VAPSATDTFNGIGLDYAVGTTTMELPDDLLALYGAEIEVRDGEPTVTVPEHELDVGTLAVGGRYRIAVLPPRDGEPGDSADEQRADGDRTGDGTSHYARDGRQDGGPPVAEGEVCEVEIEDVGDQGDGIARIGPGYVVFVPNTAVGDRVTAEITQARENFAFAEVVEGEPLSD